jgi:hypothetical protein
MTTWWLWAIREDGEPVVEPHEGTFALFRSLGAPDVGDDGSVVMAPRTPTPTVDDSAIALPEPDESAT